MLKKLLTIVTVAYAGIFSAYAADSTIANVQSSAAVAGTVLINEVMASNATTLRTRQGEYVDWIELCNTTSTAVDLSGWYLTDSIKNLSQWQFPAGTTLKANGYLIIFCDSWTGEPYTNGEYHANFSLSKEGEYVALVNSDGITIISDLIFPAQYTDVSYGNDVFYKPATPGKVNGSGFQEPVSEVVFSEPRGYKNGSFTLSLSSETDGATIYYTLDGTSPSSVSTRYTSPLSVNKITFIRAIATKEGHLDSIITTRTWLYMDEILSQPTDTPAGWPNSYSINNHKLEYGMNSRIVRNNKTEIRRGMTNIASISVVTDLTNLFDSAKGIYVNPNNDGEAWERSTSIELIDPSGGNEFQIEGGIRIRGAYSRSSSNPKHSLRFFFREEYGGKLKFPLFGNEGASEFDKVDLRTSQNFSWSFESSPYNTFIRETFSRDSQGDSGMPYTRSRYYHLYINGQYWGLYQTQERSDADFAKTYLGGDDKDWDCIKTSQPGYYTEASDGNMKAFTDLYNIAVNQGFSGIYSTNYNWIKGVNDDGTLITNSPVYLDEDNLINYMLITYFARDPDCPVAVNSHANNLYGLYNRVTPTGFKWFKHDGEHSMAANRGYPVTTDLTSHGWHLNTLANFNPMRLHQKLMDHPDYKMHWIDTVQKQMLNEEGVLSLSHSLERWNRRQAELDQAIIMESARWGHGNTRDTWITECNYVKDSFSALSASYLLKNMRDRGWFPSIDAPSIRAIATNDSGNIELTITGNNTLYYTTDGSDPRLVGGEINPFAQVLEGEMIGREVLVATNSNWSYYDEGNTPTSTGSTYWYSPYYDYSSWKIGKARLGFGSKSVNTTINKNKTDGSGQLITAYFRKDFEFTTPDVVPGLILKINADDGAIFYLNGVRLILQNMVAGYNCNTLAQSIISGDDEDLFQIYEIDPKYLVTGRNTIAVEVHQGSTNSSDLYFDLELATIAGYSQKGSQGTLTVAPNTMVKIRTWDGNEWSAICELDTTVYGDYSDLKVTEMMYAAKVPEGANANGWDRDDFAWIELQNTGTGTLNLDGVQFTAGIDYLFPNVQLTPGGRVVLAKNPEAFSTLYNTNGMFLLGSYSGNLARKGETLTLQSPQGEEILSYTYSNSWYPITDQGGYSLVVVDTAAAAPLWSSAENWKPSAELYGSPFNCDGTPELLPPLIKAHPQSQSAIIGDAVIFSVTAVGSTPMSYQWYKDGVAIIGATDSIYSLNQVVALDSGIYTVQITNTAGSCTSREAILSAGLFVYTPPSILVQPANQTISLGSEVTFVIGVKGTSPLEYQWYKNGFLIEGATNPSYTILKTTLADQADYHVIVTNPGGSATSQVAYLDFLDPAVLVPGDTILPIAASNSGSPAAETAPLAIDGNVNTKYLNYGRVNSGFIVTPSLGSTLLTSMQITTANDCEGRDPTVCEIYGTDEAILSTENSTGTAENWTLIDTVSFTLPSERFTPSEIIPITSQAPYLSYKVIFTALKEAGEYMQLAEFQFHGTSWTNGIPTVTTQPANHAAEVGSQVIFHIAAMGTLPLTYQWYKDSILIPNATGTQLTIQNIRPEDAGYYIVKVKNNLGNVFSKPALLTVNEPIIEVPTLSWNMDGDGFLVLDFTGTLYESTDLQTWTPVIGAEGHYSVDTRTPIMRYYRSGN